MKRRSQDFYPPQLNPSLVRLLQLVAPPMVRWAHQLDLTISAEPALQLGMLRKQPCLLLCNHPTFQDPLVIFLLSSRLGEPFYYMAAQERFGNLKGWFYQQLGAYSIRRGLADRDSIAYTLELLTQPDCKLVIFPEGGCSFQNDTVMPFRPGAIQMALQAMTRQVRQGNPPSDLLAVPISLKYRYTGSMTPVIEQTLKRLEQALEIVATGDYYQRLRVIAEQVLLRCEQAYGLTPPPDVNWNDRITALKAEILQQCEQQLGLKSAIGEPNRERVYRIQHTMQARYTHTILPRDGNGGWEIMSKATSRVLNFDAIYDGYVGTKPTPERFLDTLIRLEREIFDIDQPPAKGHRQAFVRVGNPVNLKEYLLDYQSNRAETVNRLVQQLQTTVQTNLDLLSEATARGISW
jgi:hypothetical protein